MAHQCTPGQKPGEPCHTCAAKDQLLHVQNQIIEELKTTIQRISGGTVASQILTATTGGESSQTTIELPTMSLEELSSYADVQQIQFVPAPAVLNSSEVMMTIPPLVNLISPTSNASGPAEPSATAARKRTAARRGGRGTAVRGLHGRRGPNVRRKPQELELEVIAASDMPPSEPAETAADIEHTEAAPQLTIAQENTGGDNESEPDESDPQESRVIINVPAGDIRTSHVLVLGSPHTRKIPLRCPLPNCPHGEYRAWDRDLLRRHFEKYHPDTHPNPLFNYLCPYDECRYISYNEPSYALYTHVKNVHREYLAQLEQAANEGTPPAERNLSLVHIDRLPSEMKRTPVPILGTISMEKAGLKCPLPVCEAGTTIFKYSSMKKLVEHFEKLHSFTHPNPLFVYCCPVEGCDYNSDVGNFRVYKHMKSAHAELFITVPLPTTTSDSGAEAETNPAGEAISAAEATVADGLAEENVDGDGSVQTGLPQSHGIDVQGPSAEFEGNGDVQAEMDEATMELPEDFMEEELEFGTKVILKGSHNMIVEPMRCPVENCSRPNFEATSTVLMKRHFWRHHRKTHPNPVFYYTCPVEGCDFVGNKEITANMWRHIKKYHPETLPRDGGSSVNVVENALVASGIHGEAGEEFTPEERPPPRPEEQIRVEGVEDVLQPGMLVKPFQLHCLYPNCPKPPFSGADKTQLLRHYAHYHANVDRKQGIIVCCPMKDCDFLCLWPPQPLHYHVESVHGRPALEPGQTAAVLKPEPAGSSAGEHTPIRIVGRPYTTGSFWCPVPGCGYSNGVLLHMRSHVVEDHRTTHPNPAFIYVCPIQGCSFAKQSNYQALCTHMQREHGMKKERPAPTTPTEVAVELEENGDEDGGSPTRKKRARRTKSASVSPRRGPRKSTNKSPGEARTRVLAPRRRSKKQSDSAESHAKKARSLEADAAKTEDDSDANLPATNSSESLKSSAAMGGGDTSRRGPPRRAKANHHLL